MDNKDNIEYALKNLFETHFGMKASSLSLITGSGSDRVYYRMSAPSVSCIGTYVPDRAEAECFVKLAADFLACGCAVPEVYAVSPDWQCYLQEDLGDKSLFASLNDDNADSLIRETLSRLISLQNTPYSEWEKDIMNKPFSKRQALWDLNYFKYEYLKPLNVIYDEDLLEDDFQRLSERLEQVPDEFCGFMIRDCQSRNVMITESGPVFIDFQGGRRGPVLYDVVSFLWQARAGFDDEFRASMLDFYCSSYCDGESKKKEAMLSNLDEIVLFRILQVLGAYGFRGLVQKKSHFLMSIPGALSNLKSLLSKGVLDGYPELKKVSATIVKDSVSKDDEAKGKLVVEIFSFSYKKGYPQDLSGNGGGFMFDCRAMHNPGRYAQYKQLTGRDTPVIEFLEEREEVRSFLKNAWNLTDPAVERYLSRGFTHIQIGFGCTGGQHRSVYCAEHTARHIREMFPEVEVRLLHRELSIRV